MCVEKQFLIHSVNNSLFVIQFTCFSLSIEPLCFRFWWLNNSVLKNQDYFLSNPSCSGRRRVSLPGVAEGLSLMDGTGKNKQEGQMDMLGVLQPHFWKILYNFFVRPHNVELFRLHYIMLCCIVKWSDYNVIGAADIFQITWQKEKCSGKSNGYIWVAEVIRTNCEHNYPWLLSLFKL